jgi:superfamily II DNA or RNA helicase
MTLRPGQTIHLKPFGEPATVFLAEPAAGGLRLGVVFTATKRAEIFVLSEEEVRDRVQVQATLAEQIASGNVVSQRAFALFADGLRIRMAYSFDPHYAVSVTQVDLLPHQVDAVYGHILPKPKIRFLLADDPGLGKTIEAGLVVRELKARGALRTALAVVPAHLEDQWKREMWDWFRERFQSLDRNNVEALNDPEFVQRNPSIITSLDFAKREENRELLARHQWDLVIFDEAHKLSATESHRTLRYDLGERIAHGASYHLLMLTATPHRGDDYAYFRLVTLLDPYLAPGPEALQSSGPDGLPFVLRRTKENVKDLNGQPLFKPRTVETPALEMTDAERGLYDEVTGYVKRWYARVEGKSDRRSRNIQLALITLQRRATSSVFAIRQSLIRRRSKLIALLERWELLDETIEALNGDSSDESQDRTDREREELEERLEGITAARSPEELREEIRELDRIIQTATRLAESGIETKVIQLERVVENFLKKSLDEKLLIFTEFKDTLYALQEAFQRWGYDPAIIHGDKRMAERIEEEQKFRHNTQVMIATDAAGEGINLQFCRLMVNYDLPWNPNRLEQRMGRIHRYGQQRPCIVFNLLYKETREGEVLHALMEKLDAMRRALRSESVFDVIGDLLEGVHLEDLIMRALTSSQPKREVEVILGTIERRVQEYRSKIEQYALAGRNIDLSPILRDDLTSKMMRVVPFDVQRYLQAAVELAGGTLVPLAQGPGQTLRLPAEFVRRHNLSQAYARGARITFDKREIRESKHPLEFVAPGHTALEAFISDHASLHQTPVKAVLRDPQGRSGWLWLFRTCVEDGYQAPALERLICLYKEASDGEPRLVDPRVIWDLETAGPVDASEWIAQVDSMLPVIRESASVETRKIFDDARARRARETAIKRRYLEATFEHAIAETNSRLLEYDRRRKKGEDVGPNLRIEEEKLKRLIEEKKARIEGLEKEEQLFRLEPELLAVAVVIPARVDGADDRHSVEAAAMQAAMQFERARDRDPKDVSREFVGYDIESRGESGIRHIEVKGFSTTGVVVLTPHEMQMARRLEDTYYIYAVENALTNPTVHEVPAGRLPAGKAVVGIVRFEFPDWKKFAKRG